MNPIFEVYWRWEQQSIFAGDEYEYIGEVVKYISLKGVGVLLNIGFIFFIFPSFIYLDN